MAIPIASGASRSTPRFSTEYPTYTPSPNNLPPNLAQPMATRSAPQSQGIGPTVDSEGYWKQQAADLGIGTGQWRQNAPIEDVMAVVQGRLGTQAVQDQGLMGQSPSVPRVSDDAGYGPIGNDGGIMTELPEGIHRPTTTTPRLSDDAGYGPIMDDGLPEGIHRPMTTPTPTTPATPTPTPPTSANHNWLRTVAAARGIGTGEWRQSASEQELSDVLAGRTARPTESWALPDTLTPGTLPDREGVTYPGMSYVKGPDGQYSWVKTDPEAEVPWGREGLNTAIGTGLGASLQPGADGVIPGVGVAPGLEGWNWLVNNGLAGQFRGYKGYLDAYYEGGHEQWEKDYGYQQEIAYGLPSTYTGEGAPAMGSVSAPTVSDPGAAGGTTPGATPPPGGGVTYPSPGGDDPIGGPVPPPGDDDAPPGPGPGTPPPGPGTPPPGPGPGTPPPDDGGGGTGTGIRDRINYQAIAYDPMTAQNAAYAPYLQDVAQQALVEQRMAGLMSMDNPFARRAYSMGLDAMNARGLAESEMGQGAAMRAVMDYAYPVASADAATEFTQATQNQQLANEARQFAAKEANTFALQNMEAVNQSLRDYSQMATAARAAGTEKELQVWETQLKDNLARWLQNAETALQLEDNEFARKNLMDTIVSDLFRSGLSSGIFADATAARGFFETIDGLYPDITFELLGNAADSAADDIGDDD